MKTSRYFLPLLYIFLLSIYLLVNQGIPVGYDQICMYLVTKELVEKHSIAITSPPLDLSLQKGKNGKYYSKFGIGQSIAEIPFFILGKALSKRFFTNKKSPSITTKHLLAKLPPASHDNTINHYFIFLVTSFVTPFITALGCLIFFKLCLLFKYPPALSFILTLIYGLATPIFPYSKFLFSEPLQNLTLLISVYYIIKSEKRIINLVLSGIFFGFTILTKPVLIILVLPFIVYIFMDNKIKLKGFLISLCVFLLTTFVGSIFTLYYNKIRFGNFFNFGYNAGQDGLYGFSVPFFSGLYGLLFSSGKSIFIYSPVFIISIFAVRKFFFKAKKESIFLGLIILTFLSIYSKWWAWHGDWSWGPRFILPLVPYLLLPLGALLSDWKNLRHLAKYAVIFIVLMSLYIQLLGVCVNYNKYLLIVSERLSRSIIPSQSSRTIRDNLSLFHFTPEFSPIAGHHWIFKYTFLNMLGFNKKTLGEKMKEERPWKSLIKDAAPIKNEANTIFDFWFLHFYKTFPQLKKFILYIVSIMGIFGIGTFILLVWKGFTAHGKQ